MSRDLAKAIAYYQKAAETGYDLAWFEWGSMYKNGIGTAQDYDQALVIFKKGAAKGIANCFYAQGYMTYKGLGTTQDYSAAVILFQKAAEKNAAGIYMLGLCYRNGYGIEKDEQKGIYWLNKSAAMSYTFAQNELEETQPENENPSQAKTVSIAIAETDKASIEAPEKLKKFPQKWTKGNIRGLYTGTLLHYDFSGQNIISSTPIKVNFDKKGKVLTRIWKEQEVDSLTFNATIKEKKITFTNTKIKRVEHFSHKELKKYSLRKLSPVHESFIARE